MGSAFRCVLIINIHWMEESIITGVVKLVLRVFLEPKSVFNVIMDDSWILLQI